MTVDMVVDKTRRREIGLLGKAMLKTGISQGTVIALREEGSERTSAGQIDIIPAWKWALVVE